MISELIRHLFGWEVWSTVDRDDPVRIDRAWEPWHALRDGWMVGTWTGPRRDLLCVRPCTSLEQARTSLAPPAPTVLMATLASVVVRAALERRTSTLPVRARPHPHIPSAWPRSKPALVETSVASVLAEIGPAVKRRYARELQMIAQRLAVPPL